MKTAALHNLGCKVNSYETDAMQQLLEDAGYTIVSFHDKADVYVINTCSVTNAADHKSRQMIHKARKMNPDAVVVAAGCYVQTATDQVLQDTSVDIVIGNNRKNDLIHEIDEILKQRNSQIGELQEDRSEKKALNDTLDINEGSQPYEEMHLLHPTEHTRAFLKVQDGCNQFCSYCIIPYARGRIRSRNMDSVLEETRHLAENGYQEVVLTGIHLSSYGRDMDDVGLLDLIEAINAVDGIKRIRLGSLEPRIITEPFVQRLSSMEKVCPHFHLSLQSGADTVLKRMNRHYTTEEYLEGCRILRKYYEHPAITTDIIVGFPGETEEEFEQSVQFAKKAAFYEIHVFKYSRRSGTVADRMPDQIPEPVKTSRSHILLQTAQELKQKFLSWYSGRTVQVLFEDSFEKDGKRFYEGFTPEYVKIHYPSQENLHNQIKTVEFSESLV